MRFARLKCLGLASALAVGLAASPALAQSQGNEEEEKQPQSGEETISPIVVSAMGYEQEILDAPASISVVTWEELEQRPFSSLADAVRDIPGVSYVGGDQDQKDITIRGMPGEYTLILVDGKRQNTRTARPNGSGGFEANQLPPLQAIERIEVIRGPMSSLYGSDAIGGVVNIITRKTSSEWAMSVGLDYTLQEDSDSGNIANGNFYISGPLIGEHLAVQIYGSGNFREEDNIVSGYSGNDNKNITGKLIFSPLEKQEIILEATRSIQDRESSVGKSASSSSTSSSSTRYSRNFLGASYNADWDIMQSKLAVYREVGKRTYATSNREPEVTNTVAEGSLSIPLPRNTLVVGGQYQHAEMSDTGTTRSGQRNTVIEAQVEQYALFLEDELTILDNLFLTGGVRLDNHENYGSHWSPRGYLVYHPTSYLTLKGGVSRAFRTPDIKQTSPNYGYPTNGGAAVMYGDQDLKPETSTTSELGVHFHNDYGLNASVTYFHTDFKNKITNYNTGTLDPLTGLRLFKYDNIGRARIRGLETSVDFPIVADWDFRASYTYLDSRRLSDEEQYSGGGSTKGAPLTMTPRHKGNAKVGWQATDDLNFYLSGEYTGTQIYSGMRTGYNGPRKSSAYTTADVGLSYQLNENIKLNAAIININDSKVDNPDDYSGLADWETVRDGRRYWVGMVYSF